MAAKWSPATKRQVLQRHRRVKWKAAGAREFDLCQALKQRSQMRLFLIRTGEVGDQLRGELVTVDVGSQDYDATSYTWADENGDTTKCCLVRVSVGNNPEVISRFLVTRNCDAVLRRVRSRYYTKYVWIDSICINQSDIEERGHQVNLMP